MVGGLLFDAHADGIAIPMGTAGVGVGPFIELDASLTVDEQRAVRSEVIEHHTFEMIHVS
ncbi:hypothetical protein APY30_16445 [Xanthomonas citri pv. malvacearum]|nr:hypothetical protein APY30_16445 [Xanthomonas citri pv. malvacearum]